MLCSTGMLCLLVFNTINMLLKFMKKTSTIAGSIFKKCLVLVLTIFSFSISQSLYAHRVEAYTTTGCAAGQNLTIDAIITNAPSITWYSWQYKDATGIWKCFVNGSNTINGVSFTVSGAKGTGANNSPLLTIANGTVVLENVLIRVLMRENAEPCGAPSGTTWGGDDLALNEVKVLRLHIYTGSGDCGGTTPGCIGNVLSNTSGYYGGFENKVYNSSSATFTDNNFVSGAGSTDYTISQPTAVLPTTSGSGTAQIWNNPYTMNTSNTTFAPHTGNYQMIVHGVASTQKRAWYKTVAVVPGATYGFSVWVARTQGSNAFNLRLTANGNNITTAAVSTTIAQWNNISGSYVVPAGVTSIEISISDVSTSLSRYFSLDDICFRQTSAPLGSIGDRVWYDTNRDGIQDASENGIMGVTVKLRDASNIVIATTTTNSSGNYLFSGLAAGTYTVEFPVTVYGYILSPAYVGTNRDVDSDPSGSTGITPTITLAAGQNIVNVDAGFAPDCSCTNSPSNLLTNGSFENGTTGWSWSSSNGSLTTGTGYVACGTKNGFNNQSSGTSKVWQDVNVAAGSTVVFTGFAGTHTPGIACSPTLSLIFLNAANTVLSQSNVTVTRDVDINNSQLEQYSITAVAPAGATKVRVQSSITCNTMKLDAFCLTVSPTCVGGGTWNLNLPNGTLGTSQAYTVNGVTITAYGFNNGNPGTPTALYGKNDGGDENGVGINSNVNHEIDINHFVQLDLNQLIAANATAATMTIGSMQAGEPANVYGSNSLGVIGTLLMTVPITLDNTPFTMPGFPAYRYISVQASAASPADVLLQQVSFSCPQPLIGSIGDRVWVDTNKDGVQDAGEVGLAGVVVTLYDGTTNTVLASTITDAYGNYLFSKLATGTDYQVRFSLVPGYRFSPNTGAVSVATNSDANLTTGRTGTITLTNAAPNVTYVDAGMYYTESARIGDFVWNDLNKNGIQDAGEPGIAGVTVMLYTSGDVLYRSTITSNNGYYFFNDLAPGTYYVKIAPPIGYQVSPKNAGGNTNLDSDIDPLTRKTANITVVAGTNNLTIDAGLNVTTTTGASASLGDRVWEDLNNNNLQNAGEPGIANVTVQLYNTANVLQATVTTDAFGNYIFNGLTPGSYYVKFTLPSGYTYVTAHVGADTTIDSDPNTTTGISQTVTLVADEINTTIDAGMRRITAGATLGDYVWYDLNKNGVQDGGNEVGVPGITVILYSSTNTVVATTTTNTSGFYLFTGLAAGTYTVGFENIPFGYGFSPNAGAVTVANNSDVNPSTGRTANITVAAGSSNTYVDAGLIITPNTFDSKATVGDRVWNDLNNNGIQDAGEPGVPGVVVTLYAADGTTVIATTTTDALGYYLFSNLDAGTYVVGFGSLPSGYVFATKDAGTDDSKDSDADITTGKTAPFTLAAGEINLTIDAGARNSTTTLSSIGNFVWYDVNSNGIQDAGEPGAAGVSVALKNTSGTTIKTTTTSVTGEYRFTDLAAGTYNIQFGNLPAGYTATTKNAAGSTAANNSDADPVTLTTDAIVLPANTYDPNWDMGIKSTTRASVGDFVWNDVNMNGIQDAGEPGVAGVTVTLYDNNNVAVSKTITDANGFYLFSNLLPGTYSVGFSTIPASSSFTTQNATGSTAANNSDPDPATGKTATFTLVGGQSKTDIDAGLVSLKAAVGDYVWHDQNRNGIQDATEKGIPGITVTLYKSTNATIGDGDDVAVASAVTDANGYYFINNVPVAAAGSQFYMRYTDVLTGYSMFTLPLTGGAAASNNSKVTQQTLSNGRTGFFTLNPGQVYRDMDAGLYKPINISGHVWIDQDELNPGGVDKDIPSGSSLSVPNNLLIYLIDNVTGAIVDFQGIQNDGSFTFFNVAPNKIYRIQLSQVGYNPGDILPNNPAINKDYLPVPFKNTGEWLGPEVDQKDGNANGELFVPVQYQNVYDANFGIFVNNGAVVTG